MSRAKFFLTALVCSFTWYVIPGYLFTTLTSISWVCWVFPKSVTAQQLGSGLKGLGLGALTLDWSVASSFLFSPLISPFFAIVNVFVGYALIVYTVIPIAYWGLDVYNAKTFPIFSSEGQKYNISAIVNHKFELDVAKYGEQGRIHLSLFFALTYGFGFATIASTLSHTPGLNIITEYVFGLIYPGRPIANVCFKTYGFISMAQAVSFLSDFKLGHYMKIPPRSMFLVQVVLGHVQAIVFSSMLRLFGFGSKGNYNAMNWFFLGGVVGPIIVWLLHKAFLKQSWIPLINLPILLGATGMMPPATPLNYNVWIFVGTVFNLFVFRYRKKW
ncbi:hypothetical protein KIW84_050054 [Lathyrus oleraceus]|uniref:Uncharacterized protein n=1 Tax=Pisum sativum TaxID=3888 RepID=A0A9D4WIS8_PEA|nr:hypothetical protein KIW84_050054 [Pisum sativum]